LAPGRARVDAISSLAAAAATRIAEGALNGRTVSQLASDLFVSERHLRRSLKRAAGVSPVELAQTHRLLLAKRLLTDTDLNISRVAFASGFQSLRRFNAAFRERYGRTPGSLRRGPGPHATGNGRPHPRHPGAGVFDTSDLAPEPVRLTLGYRGPLAWHHLLARLARDAVPGVERIEATCYGRTVRLGEISGFIVVRNEARERRLGVEISPALVPRLMALLARLRRLFDLDAEPGVIDAHLCQGGLSALVERRPGIRLPGAMEGFEVAVATLLREHGPRDSGSAAHGAKEARRLAGCLARRLGDHVETGIPGLDRVAPDAGQIASAGPGELADLGIPPSRARAIHELAERVAGGRLSLEPGADPATVCRQLMEIVADERLATMIVMRTLGWPDAFPDDDPTLLRATGVKDPRKLEARARSWRPWRAYAAMHLWASVSEG
jgi:AraC family transcriptional regulator of adaptative response / DNA-3-methyladenine glycosylase II